MKFNAALLVYSVLMMTLYAVVTYTGPMFQSSALAEQLAPLIDVDANTLRPHLYQLLQKNSFRKAVIISIPWLIISVALLIRILNQLKAAPPEE